MTLIDHALSYAKRGALVFPLKPNKTPYSDNGMKDGTTDADQITRWWDRWPDALIGCRVPEPVVVLDIDPRHGGDNVWNALIESYGGFRIGRQHHSGRNDGGFHAWGQHPGGKLSTKRLTNWAVANGCAHKLTTPAGREKWTCGIDILHHGHRYTVLPPSPHPETGHPYEWDIHGKPLAFPQWLTELLAPPDPKPATPPQRERINVDGDSIADWYTNHARWGDILTGWHVVAGDGEHDGSRWRHPNATADYSATIKHGCLFVYSDQTEFEQTETDDPNGYTKFKAFSEARHAGNMSDAARAAREMRDGATTTRRRSTATVAPDPARDEPTEEPWPEPVTITDSPRPPFPLHIFPPWISAQVAQAAEEMQLTPDLAAQLAITAMSIVTAGRVEVKVNGRWKEWTNTYTVTALPPSAGKSPTVGMMTGALDRWEEELAEDAERLIDDRTIDRKDLEKQRDDAQKRGEISAAKGFADQLRDIPPIVAPRLMADDATPEKLVDMLHDQNGRLALVSTEGGLFGMMVGRYSDKANLDVYLGAWSGDTIRVDRVERGSKVVRRPRLSIGLTVQPTVLVEVGRNRELVGRGLTARFMYSRPMDTVGIRDKTRESTYCDSIEARYEAEILKIARIVNEQYADEPLRLEFSPEARKTFLAWTAAREELLKPFGPLRHMAEWVAKCDSTTARLAGQLHVADGINGTVIDLATVERAIEVGDYWTEHARSTFDVMGASDDLGHARHIHEWLAGRSDQSATITFRDIQQHIKKRVPKVADMVPAVDLLVEYGWLRPLFDGDIGMHVGRGKPSPSFAIHPALLSSPMIPHIPHIRPQNENGPPQNENVGDMGEVGPKRPSETTSYINESQEQDAPDPGPTSPTSTPDDDIDLSTLEF